MYYTFIGETLTRSDLFQSMMDKVCREVGVRGKSNRPQVAPTISATNDGGIATVERESTQQKHDESSACTATGTTVEDTRGPGHGRLLDHQDGQTETASRYEYAPAPATGNISNFTEISTLIAQQQEKIATLLRTQQDDIERKLQHQHELVERKILSERADSEKKAAEERLVMTTKLEALQQKLQPDHEAITDQQLVALQTRLNAMYSTKLVTEEAMIPLEDCIADFIASKATRADLADLSVVARSVRQLIALSEGMPVDRMFARQATRKFAVRGMPE